MKLCRAQATPGGNHRRSAAIRSTSWRSPIRIDCLNWCRFAMAACSPVPSLSCAVLQALMAHDLATTPSTGVRIQACGDCHLLNFGLFATPERNLVFDINDFDETLPAPWEWDIKRLAVSFVIAGRDNRLSDAENRGGRSGMRTSLSGTPARVFPDESAGDLVHAAGC